MNLKCFSSFLIFLLLVPETPATQERILTLDAIYNPDRRAALTGTLPKALTWIDTERYLSIAHDSSGSEWQVVDAATGLTEPLFDVEQMENAFAAALVGMTASEVSAQIRAAGLILHPTQAGGLLSIANDLYYYDFSDKRAVRLTVKAGVEEEASFSPNGNLVAFVRHNNLFVVDLQAQQEQQLTTDGNHEILNAKLDWLYQEEIYGRGRFRAYWWSPDSTRVAFLQLDERPVPEYPIVDHIPYRPMVEVTDYPKAGDPNPTVALGVVQVANGDLLWLDLSQYDDVEILIVNVGWTPDSDQISYQVQNREQTWLDLNFGDVTTGKHQQILRETTQAWVNGNGNPIWLNDGSFLWFSERSGFRHLYQYQTDGTLVRPVTSGRWDLRTLYGVDEASDSLYYRGTEHSVLGTQLYKAQLSTGETQKLSNRAGTHRASFNPTFTKYIGYWSDVSTPTQRRLHDADGTETRIIEANPTPALSQYQLSTPEFLQINTRDGFLMEAMMIKPPEFDPSKRYPVYQHTYAGPGAQQVINAWRGTEYLFFQFLAQNGIIVWIVDNRSASGKGVESQWPVYGRLGELELQDLEDGVTWLKQQPYIDGSKIALSGWSYGGFMTAYAMTHSKSFAAGIIGAPVTDWRNYDSIYTERYMQMPQNNFDGYEKTAPAKAASQLYGRALIIHGTIDDNVHLQNTIQLVHGLQQAGKSFELMVYPKSRHGVTNPSLNHHLRQLMCNFVMRTIGEPAPSSVEACTKQ